MERILTLDKQDYDTGLPGAVRHAARGIIIKANRSIPEENKLPWTERDTQVMELPKQEHRL